MNGDVFEPELNTQIPDTSAAAPGTLDIFASDQSGLVYPSDTSPEYGYEPTDNSVGVQQPPPVQAETGHGFDWSSMFKTIAKPVGDVLSATVRGTGQPGSTGQPSSFDTPGGASRIPTRPIPTPGNWRTGFLSNLFPKGSVSSSPSGMVVAVSAVLIVFLILGLRR